MTRLGSISVATLLLVFGATVAAGAQGKTDKGKPKDEKAAPAPHAEKPAPAPHPEKAAPVQHVQQQAQHAQQQAQHVQQEQVKQAQRNQQQAQHVQQEQIKHVQQQAQHNAQQAQHVQQAQIKRAEQQAQRAAKPAPAPHLAPRATVVAQAEQQQRIRQQEQQVASYRQHLAQDTRVAQQREAELLKQNRRAQYRFQQQYYARLAQQQQQLAAARDYSQDPYVTAPYSYRYLLSGTPRYTNQYGANVLKQSVDYGYQQGYEAGQADRQDGWAANYRNSYAYTDANYGYAGTYVNQSDYNYYFRQGFQRGYNDGYYSRSQYGSSLNGSPSILSTVLSSILGLASLR